MDLSFKLLDSWVLYTLLSWPYFAIPSALILLYGAFEQKKRVILYACIPLGWLAFSVIYFVGTIVYMLNT